MSEYCVRFTKQQICESDPVNLMAEWDPCALSCEKASLTKFIYQYSCLSKSFIFLTFSLIHNCYFLYIFPIYKDFLNIWDINWIVSGSDLQNHGHPHSSTTIFGKSRLIIFESGPK